MPRFHYRGRTDRGEAVEGYLDAGSTDAVATQLMNTGVTPIDIREAEFARDPLAAIRGWLTRRAPTLEELILFSRQMFTLMHAGVPITRSLVGLMNTTRNVVLAEVLRDVAESLEGGRDLASSLARHPEVFSSLFISMVRVGENTGRLDEAFLQISRYLEQEKDTRDRIKQALRYPTIVIVAIGIAIGVINVLVIPAFAKIFSSFNVALPLPTRILVAISDFSVAYWRYILGGLFLAFYGTRLYLQTERGRYQWDKFKLRLPIVGSIILRATLGRFARSFAMASRSGVPLIQTLSVVARAVNNEFIADRILIMRTGVERGESLSRTAAATAMFTPIVLQMIAVGEETGAVDDLLDEVGGFYEREVDYDLKNLSSAIEPILILAIGAMVLILALGVFLPMWDLASAARAR